MSTRDAARTRARILAAASAEFAAHGLSGARVERIASRAEVNVRMIYAYFGGKTHLFDAAVAAALDHLAEAVPPQPDDPSAWAVALFDHHLADPTALHLAVRAQLERPEATAETSARYLTKIAGWGDVAAEPIGAVDLVTFVYALAQAWILSPAGLRAADGSDPDHPDRIAAHRAALAAAVSRMLRAPGT